ncbi:hypothetical protein [Porticoccus sp.]
MTTTVKTLLISAALVLLMLVTRSKHFGSAISLPDASLAVFLLAGFHLRRLPYFLLFCVLAVASDYWAIQVRGVSSFCVTSAYGFLLPTYFCLWWAGVWGSKQALHSPRAWLQFGALILAAITLAFVISSGSFYLFAGYFQPSWAEAAQRVALYYPRYLVTPLCYLGLAALFQLLLAAPVTALDPLRKR